MKKVIPLCIGLFFVGFIIAPFIFTTKGDYANTQQFQPVADQPKAVAVAPPVKQKPATLSVVKDSDAQLAHAFSNRISNLQIEGVGTVFKILPDDIEGSRHQKFLIRLGSGQTLLIAHNIDLAPRVVPLDQGDMVAFYGEYEWNDKGGLIHWTHRDPGGSHVTGWLKNKGRVFQ